MENHGGKIEMKSSAGDDDCCLAADIRLRMK
jgi:hypothetical protein